MLIFNYGLCYVCMTYSSFCNNLLWRIIKPQQYSKVKTKYKNTEEINTTISLHLLLFIKFLFALVILIYFCKSIIIEIDIILLKLCNLN